MKKTKCSSDEDHKSNVLLKRIIAPYIIQPTTYTVNASLRSEVFPIQMKMAIAKPLHKEGDPILIENYRPINLLSVFLN